MITLLKEATPGQMSVAASVTRTRSLRRGPGEGYEECLTVRELETLGYIGRGLQAKGIAKVMGISPHTCRGHIKGLYAKLRVSSRIER